MHNEKVEIGDIIWAEPSDCFARVYRVPEGDPYLRIGYAVEYLNYDERDILLRDEFIIIKKGDNERSKDQRSRR